MNKILIVDDEPMICQGLCLTIPWDEIGAEIVGIAYNGEKALQTISELEVDIVITDVKMPIMDGLELVKQLRANHSNVQVIMISGYEDFNYVKHALHYGVTDYLLKPVNINDLVNLVKKLIQDKEVQQLKEELENKKKMIQLISRLVIESISDPKLFVELHHMMRNKAYFRIIVCEIDNYAELLLKQGHIKMEIFRESWIQHMSKTLTEKRHEHVCMFLHRNQLFSMCYSDDVIIDDDLHHEFLEFSKNNSTSHHIYWSVSDIFEKCSDLHQAYQQSVVMLDSKERVKSEFFLTSKLFSQCQKEGTTRKYPRHVEEDIIKCLFQNNFQKVHDVVNSFFDNFVSEHYLLHEAFRTCQEICHVIYRRFRELGINKFGLYDSYFYTLDLKVYNTLESLKRIFLEELQAVNSMIITTNHGKNMWITERVLKYITDHYHKDIKASEIAENMKITPNYFSLIFKQETGKNFNEYLNDVRIEKAKELLENSLDRIYEIAEKVGYHDYKYLVNNFKKKIGITPSEYRNLKVSKYENGVERNKKIEE